MTKKSPIEEAERYAASAAETIKRVAGYDPLIDKCEGRPLL